MSDETEIKEKEPKRLKNEKEEKNFTNSIGMQFVRIQAGEFMMDGCRISGIMATTALQLVEVPGKMELALTGFIGAVAGVAMPGAAGQRIAALTTPASASTTLAFAI